MKHIIIALLAIAFIHCSFHTFSDDEIRKTLEFWTPENMRKAKPIEELIFNSGFTMKKDTAPIDTAPVPEEYYSRYPYATAGRVFFLYDGQKASCTGSSTGGNAVITAGHCVAMYRKYHTNWIFVPQYNNGSQPFGAFPATKLITFDSWFKTQDMARDVAFAITSKVDGKSVSETVGYLEASTCDYQNKENITAIGYPGNIGDAQKMIRTNDRLRLEFGRGIWDPAPQGIKSLMGPGSSGGPWIMKFKLDDKNSNFVCSVNSFQMRMTDYVFGPHFDDEVLAMRKQAISE